MGENGLGEVYAVAGRCYLYLPGIGQSHFKYPKVIVGTSCFSQAASNACWYKDLLQLLCICAFLRFNFVAYELLLKNQFMQFLKAGYA